MHFQLIYLLGFEKCIILVPEIKKNALRLFTNKQYFAVHSKWPSVSYLENVFGHVPLVGNEQTRNCQLAIVWATPCSRTWEAGRLWVQRGAWFCSGRLSTTLWCKIYILVKIYWKYKNKIGNNISLQRTFNNSKTMRNVH